eukprot:scaffold1136_cov260-Pinguiococcus_pyrenoidosus.AAC.11
MGNLCSLPSTGGAKPGPLMLTRLDREGTSGRAYLRLSAVGLPLGPRASVAISTSRVRPAVNSAGVGVRSDSVGLCRCEVQLGLKLVGPFELFRFKASPGSDGGKLGVQLDYGGSD